MSMDKSRFPPLYQNLKTLSSCPGFGGLMHNSTFGVLGTIQIMVGLFNIGLAPGRTSTHPGDLTSLGAPYWLGAVCIAAGILSVIIGQCPCFCFTWYAVFMNIAGCIFAIIGIVLYAMDLAEASVVWMCDLNWSTANDNCKYVAFFAQSLLTAMDVTLIVLTVLQLCVCISAAVLGIRALCNRMKREISLEAESGNLTAFSCSCVVSKVFRNHIVAPQGIHPEPVSELVVQKPETVGKSGLRCMLNKAYTEPRGESEKRVSAEVPDCVSWGRCGEHYQGVSGKLSRRRKLKMSWRRVQWQCLSSGRSHHMVLGSLLKVLKSLICHQSHMHVRSYLASSMV